MNRLAVWFSRLFSGCEFKHEGCFAGCGVCMCGGRYCGRWRVRSGEVLFGSLLVNHVPMDLPPFGQCLVLMRDEVEAGWAERLVWAGYQLVFDKLDGAPAVFIPLKKIPGIYS